MASVYYLPNAAELPPYLETLATNNVADPSTVYTNY
jgi:hypothetical protein